MATITSLQHTSTVESHSFGLAPTTAATTMVQRSPWHSPVPYLFGGLAAMLGLIAFALLILACSYWKLSSTDNETQQSEEDDLEKGEGISKMKYPAVYEEKFVAIMAGNDIPTFLANPTPNQGFVVVPVSKDENSTSSVVVVVDDDEKPKGNENDRHHTIESPAAGV